MATSLSRQTAGTGGPIPERRPPRRIEPETPQPVLRDIFFGSHTVTPPVAGGEFQAVSRSNAGLSSVLGLSTRALDTTGCAHAGVCESAWRCPCWSIGSVTSNDRRQRGRQAQRSRRRRRLHRVSAPSFLRMSLWSESDTLQLSDRRHDAARGRPSRHCRALRPEIPVFGRGTAVLEAPAVPSLSQN
jgi:hypothetical protein